MDSKATVTTLATITTAATFATSLLSSSWSSWSSRSFLRRVSRQSLSTANKYGFATPRDHRPALARVSVLKKASSFFGDGFDQLEKEDAVRFFSGKDWPDVLTYLRELKDEPVFAGAYFLEEWSVLSPPALAYYASVPSSFCWKRSGAPNPMRSSSSSSSAAVPSVLHAQGKPHSVRLRRISYDGSLSKLARRPLHLTHSTTTWTTSSFRPKRS